MNDELKKYIDSNRAQFEQENDDLDGLWLKIASDIEQHEKKNSFLNWRILRIAAVLIVFLGIAWLVVINPSLEKNQNYADMYKFSSELLEAEGYYNSMINEKMQSISMYKDDIDPQIFKDLKALDQAMKELQKDLEDNIDNEEVINAMIQNYRIKLEILEQIQLQLEEKDYEKIQS